MPTSTVTTETLPAAGKVDLIKQASETVLALLNASSSMTNETSKRVMFQTIIATVIAIDLLGPPNHRVRNFPSANVLLAAAVALADGSKLGVPSTRKATSQDEDSKYSMRRRIWFTLVVLDRFYSVGTAMSLRVSNLSTVIAPEDRDLLGENFYHLVRKSTNVFSFSSGRYSNSGFRPVLRYGRLFRSHEPHSSPRGIARPRNHSSPLANTLWTARTNPRRRCRRLRACRSTQGHSPPHADVNLAHRDLLRNCRPGFTRDPRRPRHIHH